MVDAGGYPVSNRLNPTNENKRKPLGWVSMETQLCFRASPNTINPLLKTW